MINRTYILYDNPQHSTKQICTCNITEWPQSGGMSYDITVSGMVGWVIISLCQRWWNELWYHHVCDKWDELWYHCVWNGGMSYDITMSEMVGWVMISLCQRWWDELWYHCVRDGGMSYDITVSEMVEWVMISLCLGWSSLIIKTK